MVGRPIMEFSLKPSSKFVNTPLTKYAESTGDEIVILSMVLKSKLISFRPFNVTFNTNNKSLFSS